MKSIDNIKKITAITTAIFLTAALIASTPGTMSPSVYADHPGAREIPTETVAPESIAPMSTMSPIGETVETAKHWSCAAKAINDSPEGNALGWNPNGTDQKFAISEPCYKEGDSIVLVNVKDGSSVFPFNYEVCNVDYGVDGFFEVFCNVPPFEGSQLRYMVLVEDLDVIGTPIIPLEEIPADVAERTQNATK